MDWKWERAKMVWKIKMVFNGFVSCIIGWKICIMITIWRFCNRKRLETKSPEYVCMVLSIKAVEVLMNSWLLRKFCSDDLADSKTYELLIDSFGFSMFGHLN